MEKILRCVERRGAEGTHDARNSPRGAPRGQRQARRPPSRGAHVAPGAAGQNKAIRGASAGGFRLSPSPRLRVNLLNRAQLAPAGRFINGPVYYEDSRISDHTPTFAKRAGILPALIIVLGGSGHCGARQRRAISASQRYPDAECRDDDPLTC